MVSPDASPGLFGGWGLPLQPVRPHTSIERFRVGPPPAPPRSLQEWATVTADRGARRRATNGRSGAVARSARRSLPAVLLVSSLGGIAALSHSASKAPTPAVSWAEQVTPHLNAVASDIAKLTSPTLDSTSSQGQIGSLAVDLRASSKLGQSPVPAWGKLWLSALDEAGAALNTPSSDLTARQADLTAAGDTLVALGHDLSSR